MNAPDSRRTFLKKAGTLAGAMSLVHLSSMAQQQSGQPWFKISLAQWSLHRTLFGRKLDPLDFPKAARQDYGIEAVEYVNQFFANRARDAQYIGELKKRSEGEGVKNLLVMIDNEGQLGHASEKTRRQAVENHFKWVEAAKTLGCHSIRVNAYATGSYEEQLNRAADGLAQLCAFAKDFEMNILVENHGGLSSNGEWLAAVIRKVNLPNCGTLPDFGNFDLGQGKQYDRYKGIEEMLPYAKGVSAKSHEFDASGNEVHTDFRRMLKLVKASGFRGYVGVEYEGTKHGESEGIRLTRELLEKVRAELA